MSNKKVSILIIEDNLDLCAIYQIAFETASYDVRLSPSGMDGIAKVIESKPDVILLDIMMPDMTDLPVLTAIRTNSPMDVTIVINITINQQKDTDRAMKLDANAYLRKSDYSPSELVNMVQAIISENNKTDQLVVAPCFISLIINEL